MIRSILAKGAPMVIFKRKVPFIPTCYCTYNLSNLLLNFFLLSYLSAEVLITDYLRCSYICLSVRYGAGGVFTGRSGCGEPP